MSKDQQNPPQGDSKKAEKYLNQLINLLQTDKLETVKTDLKQFDPSSLQEHFKLSLDNFQIEISHSKMPTSGQDNYIMLFTNVPNFSENSEEHQQKIVLSYVHLSESQFLRFKSAAESQIDRKRQREEEQRFNDAMEPVDKALETMAGADDVSPHHSF